MCLYIFKYKQNCIPSKSNYESLIGNINLSKKHNPLDFQFNLYIEKSLRKEKKKRIDMIIAKIQKERKKKTEYMITCRVKIKYNETLQSSAVINNKK